MQWETHHIRNGKAERRMHEYEFTARAEYERLRADPATAEATLIRWDTETAYTVITSFWR